MSGRDATTAANTDAPATGSTGIARLLAAAGALGCGAGVGLGAYASHGLADGAARQAGLAALFLFGHGLALRVLAPGARRGERALLAAMLAGLLLFAGSLAGAALAGWPSKAAPAGGVLLMAAWAGLAITSLRR